MKLCRKKLHWYEPIGGHKSGCPECTKLRQQAWVEANRELLRARNRIYSANSRLLEPDKLNAKLRAWRRDNPDKCKESNRVGYETHRARNLERSRKNSRNMVVDCRPSYVARVLRLPLGVCPPELLEAKALNIKIARQIKELQK